MFSKTLLENDRWCVRIGFTGRYTVTLKTRNTSRKASRAESHHLLRTLECATDLGYDVKPGSKAFDVLAHDFATAVMNEDGDAWRTFFLTSPHEIASVCMY